MLPDVIETPRLTLRPWTSADAADVFAYAADEEWGRYLPVPRPYREADAREFVALQLALDREEETAWAVELEARVVGGIGARLFAEKRIAEIDYAIARACWGRGLGTEMVRAVVDVVFEHVPELIRARSQIDGRNVGSARVLEKAGMKREGVLRSNKFARGEAIDEVWYGILREEWHALRAARRDEALA